MFIRPLLSFSELVNFSDIRDLYYFFKYFTVKSVKLYGSLPLWNPLTFSGIPFAGNPLSSLFYPFFIFFYIFPVNYTFTLMFLIHFILGGFGMYVFARQKGISCGSALFSTVTFIFSWVFTSHIIAGHIHQYCSTMYLPWLFLGIDYFVKQNNSRSLCLLAVLISLIFLAGHTQIFYYELLIGSVYLVFVIVTEKKSECVSILCRFFLCGLLVLALVAVSLLPLLELAKYSYRAGGTDYAFSSQFSVLKQFAITFINPYFIDLNQPLIWEVSLYVGISPLLFSFFGYRREQKKYCVFFALLFLFSFLFALGSNGPVFKIAYNLIPGISYFRCPGRMFMFGTFSVAVLAGFGLDNITEKRGCSLHKYMWTITALFAFVAIVVNVIHSVFSHYYGNQKGLDIVSCLSSLIGKGTLSDLCGHIFVVFLPEGLRLILILSTVSILLWIWHKGYIQKLFFTGLLLILTAIDLGGLSFPFITTKPLTELVPSAPIYKKVVQDKDHFRVLDALLGPQSFFPQMISALCNAQKADGYQSILLRTYVDYILELYGTQSKVSYTDVLPGGALLPVYSLDSAAVNWPLINLLNVKYIFSPYKLHRKFLYEEGSYRLSTYENGYLKLTYEHLKKQGYPDPVTVYLYRNTNVLPRGFLLAASSSRTPDQLLTEFLAHGQKPLIPAQIKQYEPNKIVFHTDMTTPSYLIMSELMFPGWEAAIDGVCAEIMPAKIFRSVFIQSGNHEIIFTYRPNSYVWGRRITFTGILICISSGIILIIADRKRIPYL